MDKKVLEKEVIRMLIEYIEKEVDKELADEIRRNSINRVRLK